MSLEQIRKESGIYAFRKYGHFVTLDKVEERSLLEWSAKLKVDYPLLIRDDSSPDKLIRKFVRLQNIGELIFSRDGTLLAYPKREECIDKVKDRLAFWHNRLEQIIITTSAQYLARIPRLKNFWNPINFIASSLVDYESIRIEDLIQAAPSKILEYVNLLEDLGLVEQKDDLLTYTPMFSLKLEELGNESEFRDWLVSFVIQNRYETIEKIFNITQFTPTIQVENCYYRPCLNADTLVHRSLDSLTSDYTNWYSKTTRLDVRYWLKELLEVKLLTEEGKFYYGNEELFDVMIDQKKKLPDRIPPQIRISS